MGPDALLTLTGVERTYGGVVPVHALRPIDLTLNAGDYLIVTGPSGSGKSTLLNILGLLDRPTAGTYRVRDVETADAHERLRVAIRGQLFGFVFQAFHLLSGRNVVENVELGMLYGGRGPKVRRQLAGDALDRVRLSHRARVDPRTLSGGEHQRAAIARAIAGRPSVLFCDEPTGSLDSENAANVLDLIAELHADGLTVVVVTHSEDVARRGTRRLALVDGVAREHERCAD